MLTDPSHLDRLAVDRQYRRSSDASGSCSVLNDPIPVRRRWQVSGPAERCAHSGIRSTAEARHRLLWSIQQHQPAAGRSPDPESVGILTPRDTAKTKTCVSASAASRVRHPASPTDRSPSRSSASWVAADANDRSKRNGTDGLSPSNLYDLAGRHVLR